MGRVFGFVGTVVTMAIGMYIYSMQVKTLTPGAGTGNPEEVTTITGVKNDLIEHRQRRARIPGIAREVCFAGRADFRQLPHIQGERPPYIYDVEITGSSFRATATRTTKGAPAQLWITESMQIQASD